jgi:NAD(P)-dependent dehydrogenase (short-subunit alcohol dehydrogenase family)
MVQKLSGKIALVTGGSRGIGAASAKALAVDGATVALSYNASSAAADAVVAAIIAAGGKAVAFQADQADATQVKALVQKVHAQFGRLDILVNNAGVFAGSPVDAPDADIAALDRLWAVNVSGVVTAIRAASPLLSEGGRIITIGSCVNVQVPFPGIADYTATKSAVLGYSKGAAHDLAPRKITVNVVQPGPIGTEMAPAEGPVEELLRNSTLFKRYGTPEEVAAGVLFLASPEASYITGTTLNIDGGLAA